MKQCPHCHKTYVDDTLSFCLNDGSSLTGEFDRHATWQIPGARETGEPTVRLSDAETLRDHRVKPPASKRWPIFVLIAVLVVLIGGGALVVIGFAIRGYVIANTNATGTKNANGGAETGALFQDDFSGTELDSDWQVVSGEWTVRDGVLTGRSNRTTSYDTPVWAAMTLTKDLPANYSVSFRTRIVKGEVTELMLHLANGRYVRAYLYSLEQAVTLGDGTFLREYKPGESGQEETMANIGGGGTVIKNGFPIQDNTWYSVKVTAKDRTYTISVGGQVVVKYEDTKDILSKEGTIGFISNGEMQFDDLKIVKAED